MKLQADGSQQCSTVFCAVDSPLQQPRGIVCNFEAIMSGTFTNRGAILSKFGGLRALSQNVDPLKV